MEPIADFLNESIFSRKSLSRIWRGRRRYVDAITTVYRIDRAYRRVRRRTKDMAWKEKKPYFKAVHPEAAARLYELCKRNGATWVKVAQFLSARPDMLPREYIEELKKLQNDARPVSFSEIKPLLDEELGAGWRDKFEWVEEQPIATASIGQVHKAQLKDGRLVAVKVQLPNVKRLFYQDFNLFRLLAEFLDRRIKQIDVKQMVNEILRMTAEELDFRIEADNLTQFAKQNHHPRVRVPVLLPELSTERVITTEWIEGTRLVDHLDRSNKEEARDLLSVVQDSYMQQITQIGLYQADPHPGNFLVDKDKNVFILDYGVIGRLTKSETMNYTRLIMYMMGHTKEDLGKLLQDAGFGGVDAEVAEELSQYFIRTKRDKPTANTRAGQVLANMKRMQVDEVIDELMEAFQEYHIIVPNSFVGMTRVVMTISGLMQIYRVPFNWMPGKAVPKAS